MEGSVYGSEFPDNYRKELGEDIWQVLVDKVIVNDQEELLNELGLNVNQLQQIFDLAGRRPILLALFMDWFNFGKREPRGLLEAIHQITDKKLHTKNCAPV
ncbi:MAG: hypothetical protein D3910_19930 [Candidatus Electrothrix sp. ATG2]|nr:hypothetical protein [Candidatus Electrothrix sp. ATG2]